MSLFAAVSTVPPDEGFDLLSEFREDASPSKVNLGAGVYRGDDGQPYVLSVVKEATERMLHAPDYHHEYLPIAGNEEFLRLARDLVFGDPNASLRKRSGEIVSLQTISGTGANCLGAQFLSEHIAPRQIWIPDPTWANHELIWTLAAVPSADGQPTPSLRHYPYYDVSQQALDFDALIRVLRQEARKGDVVVLHACGHNPTGVDPSATQWKEIASLCSNQKLFPFFDCAYQGFASGNIDEDAFAVHHFVESGLEMAVAQSFSKNFGLYGERVGAFHLVINSPASTTACASQLKRLQRGEISNPPSFGANIVSIVLKDETLRARWEAEVKAMALRLHTMRHALYERLTQLVPSRSWGHIIAQHGMFSYTGINHKTVIKRLKDKYHIYMYSSGRISIAGLTSRNIDYVAQAIAESIAIEHERENAV